MMRDKNGTADTITLIDFDLTGYGFPAFDWAYFLYYSRQGSSNYPQICQSKLGSLTSTLKPEKLVIHFIPPWHKFLAFRRNRLFPSKLPDSS